MVKSFCIIIPACIWKYQAQIIARRRNHCHPGICCRGCLKCKSFGRAKPQQWRMCREFSQHLWTLPPSNRSSQLFTPLYFCSKLFLREAMGGGEEVERLFSVLFRAACLGFAFNLSVPLWCRYVGSSTGQYPEKPFVIYLPFASAFSLGLSPIPVQSAGAFSSLLANRRLNAFLCFSGVKWRT